MILLHHVRCVRHRCTHAEQWITGAKVTFAEAQKPWFRQGELCRAERACLSSSTTGALCLPIASMRRLNMMRIIIGWLMSQAS